jgi:hypothetical protein
VENTQQVYDEKAFHVASTKTKVSCTERESNPRRIEVGVMATIQVTTTPSVPWTITISVAKLHAQTGNKINCTDLGGLGYQNYCQIFHILQGQLTLAAAE